MQTAAFTQEQKQALDAVARGKSINNKRMRGYLADFGLFAGAAALLSFFSVPGVAVAAGLSAVGGIGLLLSGADALALHSAARAACANATGEKISRAQQRLSRISKWAYGLSAAACTVGGALMGLPVAAALAPAAVPAICLGAAAALGGMMLTSATKTVEEICAVSNFGLAYQLSQMPEFKDGPAPKISAMSIGPAFAGVSCQVITLPVLPSAANAVMQANQQPQAQKSRRP